MGGEARARVASFPPRLKQRQLPSQAANRLGTVICWLPYLGSLLCLLGSSLGGLLRLLGGVIVACIGAICDL